LYGNTLVETVSFKTTYGAYFNFYFVWRILNCVSDSDHIAGKLSKQLNVKDAEGGGLSLI
jgi:hypothetical protein